MCGWAFNSRPAPTAAGSIIRAKPIPLRPDAQARLKDPTSAIHSKRYRQARKRGGKRDGRKAAHRSRDGKTIPGGQSPQDEKQNEINDSVTVHAPGRLKFQPTPPLAPSADARASAQRHGAAVDLAAYSAAIALAGAAAWFSIRGMVVLFPGSPKPVGVMPIAPETAKL